MRRLPVFALAVLLGFAAIGCDSADDDPTDAEIFVGTWNVVRVTDQEGDKTSIFNEGINAFSATLNANATYSLSVDFKDPQRPDVPLSGSYSIDEGANALILTATLPTGPVQLPFQYDIESENEIDLSIQDVFVEPIFGTAPETYVGTITFTIERQ